MSEATIKPCPYCGGEGIHNMTGVFTQASDFVNCAADCGMPFVKREVWNRLSDASALLRAVEELGNTTGFDVFQSGNKWFARSSRHGERSGNTPVTALIALADRTDANQ